MASKVQSSTYDGGTGGKTTRAVKAATTTKSKHERDVAAKDLPAGTKYGRAAGWPEIGREVDRKWLDYRNQKGIDYTTTRGESTGKNTSMKRNSGKTRARKK